jgi:hypothetical protein
MEICLRLHLVKTKLSTFSRWKAKKGRGSQGGAMVTQQLGSLGKRKQEETLIRTSKRLKPEDSTTTESVRPTKRPKNLGEQGPIRTY